MSGSHLKALLSKNWILWRRNLCCSILEILLPVAFMFLFPALRALSEIEQIDEQSYYADEDHFGSFDATSTSLLNLKFKCSKSEGGGRLGLAPQGNSIINDLIDLIEQDDEDPIPYLEFESEKEMEDYFTSSDYARDGKSICAGLIMNDDGNDYSYTLRFNATVEIGGDDIPQTNLERIKPIGVEDLDSLDKYLENGYLALQNIVDNLILKHETGDSSAHIMTSVTSERTPDYKSDPLLEILGDSASALIDLPMLLPYLRMVNGIMSEKEKRIKEGMKIMGLNSSAFFFSWFITYFIVFTLVSIITSGVLTGLLLNYSSYGLIFLWHWQFSLAIMAMGFFTTSLFSKARVANVFAFALNFLFGWLAELGADSTSSSLKFGTSFGPSTSIFYSIRQIFDLEVAEVGLTSDTIDLEISGYKMSFHYGMMAIVFFTFMILYVYLDQVMPSEFGVRKHPLFCLMRKNKNQGRQISDSEVKYVPDGYDPTNYEQVEDQLKNLDNSNESIKIQNLRKVYPSGKLAVDGVSFNMYPGQIFALLGHNGAGKTSTINMITGLYPITEGACKVFGLDVGTQLDDIRKIMGVCPQHSVLFDQLTVYEHLELFATFKGMEKKDMKEAIDKILTDLDLQDKRDYLAKGLSGGQKRKLSTGIAFIGPSKFILLDEPSSGMDTSARRKLWEMLKNYKHGKVVLLTTHYMDEADQLGDRIAIMGEGKIQCLGGPMFLKNKFGVGYSLTIVKHDINDPSKPIRDVISKHIPQANCTSDVSSEITYQLPMDTSPKFEEMFGELDERKGELRISSYGVSVTTLEEVFLNVSKIVHKNDVTKFNAVEQQKTDKDIDGFDLKKEKIQGTCNIFMTQFGALILKRFHYFKRDKRGLFLELFMPVLMVIIGIALTKSSFVQDQKTLTITNQFWGHENNVAYNQDLPSGANVPSSLIDQFPQADFEMDAKDTDEIETLDQENFDEREEISPFRKYIVFFEDVDNTNNEFSYTALVDSRAREASTVAMNHINNAILRYATGDDDLSITVINKPFPLTLGAELVENTADGFSLAFILAIGISFLPASLVTFIVKERELSVKHQQIVSGVSIPAYWCANYFIDFVKYIIPGVLICLFALAMDAAALVDNGNYGVLWALFMMYGLSITAFVYFTSFAFKSHGVAQMATFFGNFAIGLFGALGVTIARFVSEDANKVALGLQWVFRLCPTFCVTYGLMNMINKDIYAVIEDFPVSTSPFDIKLVGGDILMLGVTAIAYFALVFVLEGLRTVKIPFLNRDVPKEHQAKDSDVEKEERLVQGGNIQNYAITLKNARKVYRVDRFKKKVAVDDVSLAIPQGECFGLLGVNGAGKTTTFKMLTGEIVPTKGEIYVSGYPIPKELNQARMLIGYCPQFDAILENLTAKEHLELYAAIKGIPKDKRAQIVQKQLHDLNLKQFENVPAGTYSGGNKRKLSVAMAMIGNPPIVFLDEPSSGMDPEARRFMWNVISKISTERKQSTVILTTHSMEEAEALSTRLAIQVDGNLKCLGTAQHIKNKYGGGYELEVKLGHTSKEAIQQLLDRDIKEKGDVGLNKIQIHEILKKLNIESLIKQISEEGSGQVINAELKRAPCKAHIVAEWIIAEKKGLALEEQLKSQFRGVKLIEHFQTFFRYRIDSDVSIGKVFGYFEKNKSEMGIEQYSVKQSSIEQIFNAFANKALEVKTSGGNDDRIIDIPVQSQHNNISPNNNANIQFNQDFEQNEINKVNGKEVRVRSKSGGSQDVPNEDANIKFED